MGSYIDKATNEEFIDNNATLNILNAKDSDYKYHYSSSTKKDAGAIAVGAAVGFVVGGPTGSLIGAYSGSKAKAGNIHQLEIYDETIISSNLNFNNSLTTRSSSNSNIISSNLNAVSGNLDIITGQILDKDSNLITTNSDAILNIASDQELDYKNEKREKLGPIMLVLRWHQRLM